YRRLHFGAGRLQGGRVNYQATDLRRAVARHHYSTSAVGSVRAELQDTRGNPLAGFSLEECPPMFGDRIEHTVPWIHAPKEPTPAAGKLHKSLIGTQGRIRFVMRDADLYSFRFR